MSARSIAVSILLFPVSVPAAFPVLRPRRLAVFAALASLSIALVAGGALAQPATERATAKPAPVAPKSADKAEKRPNQAMLYFTEEEREAWKQKIAAAADEPERKRLRGQRLAELQKRARAAKAEGGTSPKPAAQRRSDAGTDPAGGMHKS